MKTIEEIKQRIALNNKFISWREAYVKLGVDNMFDLENQAIEEYAKQVQTKIGVFLVDNGHVNAALSLMYFNTNV